MASTVQKKPPSQQTTCLFHHSLIKVIILHQLEKREVSWDTFITHPDFSTVPPIHTSPTPPTHHPSPSSSKEVPKKLKFTIGQTKEHDEEEELEQEEESDDEQQHYEIGQQGDDEEDDEE